MRERYDVLAKQPGEDDLSWEHRMDALAEHYAAMLLEICGRLGWGCGTAGIDAACRVTQVAKRLGYPTEQLHGTTQPQRKKLGAGVARAVWDRDGWECQHCGSHRDLTVDHIKPVTRNGDDEMDNLQTLCKSCNSRKGARV